MEAINSKEVGISDGGGDFDDFGYDEVVTVIKKEKNVKVEV